MAFQGPSNSNEVLENLTAAVKDAADTFNGFYEPAIISRKYVFYKTELAFVLLSLVYLLGSGNASFPEDFQDVVYNTFANNIPFLVVWTSFFIYFNIRSFVFIYYRYYRDDYFLLYFRFRYGVHYQTQVGRGLDPRSELLFPAASYKQHFYHAGVRLVFQQMYPGQAWPAYNNLPLNFKLVVGEMNKVLRPLIAGDPEAFANWPPNGLFYINNPDLEPDNRPVKKSEEEKKSPRPRPVPMPRNLRPRRGRK